MNEIKTLSRGSFWNVTASCNAHHAVSEVLAAHLEEFDGGRTLVFRERRRLSAHGPSGPAARFTVLSERERDQRSISAVWFNSFMIHDAALVNSTAQTPPNEVDFNRAPPVIFNIFFSLWFIVTCYELRGFYEGNCRSL